LGREGGGKNPRRVKLRFVNVPVTVLIQNVRAQDPGLIKGAGYGARHFYSIRFFRSLPLQGPSAKTANFGMAGGGKQNNGKQKETSHLFIGEYI
jgi:hypothetical protein